MPGFVTARCTGTIFATRVTLSMLMRLASSDLVEIACEPRIMHLVLPDSAAVGTFHSARSMQVWHSPLRLSLPPATLGCALMPVVQETPLAPFDQLAGFPSLSDTLATTSGRLSSESAVSDDLDLGIEPEVSVGLTEALKDADSFVVGPLEHTCCC